MAASVRRGAVRRLQGRLRPAGPGCTRRSPCSPSPSSLWWQLPLFGASASPLAARKTAGGDWPSAIATAAGTWAVAAVPGPAQHVADIVRATDDTLVFFAAPGRGGRVPPDRMVVRRSPRSARSVPLPHVGGTVDLYPNDQLVLVANRLTRFSRPAVPELPRLHTPAHRAQRGAPPRHRIDLGRSSSTSRRSTVAGPRPRTRRTS